VDVVLGEIDLPDSVGAVVRRAAPRLVRDGLRPPRLPRSGGAVTL
jgi:hypothetical protein